MQMVGNLANHITTKPANPGPSFPRKRESTGRRKHPLSLRANRGIQAAGYADHVIADLVRNPEGRGNATLSNSPSE